MEFLQITCKDIPLTPAVESNIRKKAEKLKKFYDRIINCRVVIELPQKHKHQGKLYNVRIDVSVPGKELVVTRKIDQDIYVAVRDAFAALTRQLEEHARKRQGNVKTHENVMHGFIARLLPDEGYGFIEGMDGNEYYFSLTNVSFPHFQQLSVGDPVEYLAEALDEGWQAHRVTRERS